MRAGAPWRDVRARYGPWGRVHDLLRRCRRDGTWSRMVTRLPRAWPQWSSLGPSASKAWATARLSS
ncbi:transposase [Streptomyces platensis]|uniref:transposase n=1 Tax=Streptomyces platensis TaxID=58346 RepID=UPI00313836B1